MFRKAACTDRAIDQDPLRFFLQKPKGMRSDMACEGLLGAGAGK